MLFWEQGVLIEAKTLGIYLLVGYSCSVLGQGFFKQYKGGTSF